MKRQVFEIRFKTACAQLIMAAAVLIFYLTSLLIVFMGFIAQASAAQDTGDEYEVSGKIMDIFDETRIYKAVVSFGDEQFLTGASGHFSAKLKPGVYKFSVTCEGYYPRAVNNFTVESNEEYDQYIIPQSFDLETYKKFNAYSSAMPKFANPPVFVINTGKYNGSKNTFSREQIDSIDSVISELKSMSDFLNRSTVVKKEIESAEDIPEESIVICRDDFADYTEGGHAEYRGAKRSSLVIINPLHNRLVGFFKVALRHELMHAIGFYTHVPPGTDSILVPTFPIPPDYTALDRKVIKLFYRMPSNVDYPHTTDKK
ncbi:MAG TPA: carboxypeptidase-like regulatory domain-containing protein [Candidatus Wallbacteria bacterium]|nr:carboxypeptidase-like regulatory domain-containing protein [Candidatus Wallbacteria bacterium]